MDKVLNILSDLPNANNYISAEIEEIELLSSKVSESIKAHQQNCDEVQHKLKEIEDLQQEKQSLFSRVKNRENEFATAMQKWEDLQSEYESLTKIDENDVGWSEKELLRKLENQMKLFGLGIQAQFLKPALYQAKINFAEDKFVIFNWDFSANTYDLQAMQPTHRNCEEMRRFLLESKDIVGFLCYVRKFFGEF